MTSPRCTFCDAPATGTNTLPDGTDAVPACDWCVDDGGRECPAMGLPCEESDPLSFYGSPCVWCGGPC